MWSLNTHSAPCWLVWPKNTPTTCRFMSQFSLFYMKWVVKWYKQGRVRRSLVQIPVWTQWTFLLELSWSPAGTGSSHQRPWTAQVLEDEWINKRRGCDIITDSCVNQWGSWRSGLTRGTEQHVKTWSELVSRDKKELKTSTEDGCDQDLSLNKHNLWHHKGTDSFDLHVLNHQVLKLFTVRGTSAYVFPPEHRSDQSDDAWTGLFQNLCSLEEHSGICVYQRHVPPSPFIRQTFWDQQFYNGADIKDSALVEGWKTRDSGMFT